MASPELAELQRINQQLAQQTAIMQSAVDHLATIDARLAGIETDIAAVSENTTHIATNSDTVAAWTTANTDALTIVTRLLASMLYVGGSGGVAPKQADVESFVERFKWESETP